MKKIVVLAAALVLSACATPASQTPGSAVSALSAVQLTSDVYRISVPASVTADQAQIRDIVLVKAAQTAKANGKTHFAVLSSDNVARSSSVPIRVGIGGFGGGFGGGGLGFGSIEPQLNASGVSGREVTVQIFSLRKGQRAPAHSYRADDILARWQ